MRLIFISLLIISSSLFAGSNNQITCYVIPPASKAKIYYRHSFPFEILENETLNEALERTFYTMLKSKIEEKTAISKIVIMEADVYPYYSQMKPEDEDDFARFVEVPSSKFSFTFGGVKPNIVIQIDSLSIYSSSTNDTDLGNAIGGLAGKGFNEAACDGDFAIDFKFLLWENLRQEVLKIGYCEADEYSDDPTKEEWNDLMNEVLEALFDNSGIELKSDD